MKELLDIKASEDEILAFAKDIPLIGISAEVRQMYMNYTIGLLSLKQQEKLLIAQNDYNRKQVFWARTVAITAILTFLVTLGILKYNPETFNKSFGFTSATSTVK